MTLAFHDEHLNSEAPWRRLPPEELGRGVAQVVRRHADHAHLYDAVVDHLAELLAKGAEERRPAVVVFPVGPLPFRELALRMNARGVGARGLFAVLMDEYCDERGVPVGTDHPLSLRGCFERDFLSVIDEPPSADHVLSPDPSRLDDYGAAIAAAGGIDTVFTGFGINGHWAFNEPSEADDDDLEGYKNLGARSVSLSCATIVQVAIGGTGGDLLGIPTRAVTIGPRELLSARTIACLGVRTWHAGVLRRALHGPVTSRFPASLVQLHGNVTLDVVDDVAALPEVNVLQRL